MGSKSREGFWEEPENSFACKVRELIQAKKFGNKRPLKVPAGLNSPGLEYTPGAERLRDFPWNKKKQENEQGKRSGVMEYPGISSGLKIGQGKIPN